MSRIYILIVIGIVMLGGVFFMSDFNDVQQKEELINIIISENILAGERVGFGGEISKSYSVFKKLKSILSDQELINLTEHENAVVRCYAFWAITERESIKFIPVIEKHLKDNEKVEFIFGCKGGSMLVSDWFVDIVKLNKEQKNEIEQIINLDFEINSNRKAELIKKLKTR